LKRCRLHLILAAFSTAFFLGACSGTATSSSSGGSNLALPTAIRPAGKIPADSLFVGSMGLVEVYQNSGSNWPKTNEITEHIGEPVSMGIDQDGFLFVANHDRDDVAAFNLAENGQYIGRLKRVKTPQKIALDAQGDVAVINSGFEINGPTIVTVFPFGGSNGSYEIKEGLRDPVALAYDKDGNLFVANGGNDVITVYAPGAMTPMLKISDGVTGPVAMVSDRNGRLYVANYSGYNVTAYDPPEYNLVLTIPTNLKNVVDVAIGPGAPHLYIAADSTLRSEVIDYDVRTGKSVKITDGISHPKYVIICSKTYVCVANQSTKVTIYNNDALVHTIDTGRGLYSITSR
jgi:sugar lactone lactonase YvrE